MSENETLISKDMLDRLIELAVAKPVKTIHAKPVIGEGEYLVHVDYTTPSFDELKRAFGMNTVSSLFEGCLFQKHPSCADIDETPGERVMLVKDFGRKIRIEEVIKEMDELGYRPATHLELYAFPKMSFSLDLQQYVWIVALGSGFVSGNDCLIPFIWRGDFGWHLNMTWSQGDWRGNRFLFVRK